MRKIFVIWLALLAPFSFFTSAAIAGDKIVMFDSKSCGACKQFKREMAPVYRRSRLGKAVPLRIVDSNGRAMKRYRKRVHPISYTPTFVLMRNGREIARSVGYGGRKSFMRTVRAMHRRK